MAHPNRLIIPATITALALANTTAAFATDTEDTPTTITASDQYETTPGDTTEEPIVPVPIEPEPTPEPEPTEPVIPLPDNPVDPIDPVEPEEPIVPVPVEPEPTPEPEPTEPAPTPEPQPTEPLPAPTEPAPILEQPVEPAPAPEQPVAPITQEPTTNEAPITNAETPATEVQAITPASTTETTNPTTEPPTRERTRTEDIRFHTGNAGYIQAANTSDNQAAPFNGLFSQATGWLVAALAVVAGGGAYCLKKTGKALNKK